MKTRLAAFLGWAILILPGAAICQSQAKKTVPSREAAPAVEAPAEYRAASYQDYNRRDPFLNPLLLRSNAKGDEEIPRGDAPPGIAGMYINEVQLLGMSSSPQGETAVFLGSDKRVYFLHEGDHLFDGFIKSVTLESVQLIRETKMRSGKVLTEEITKRLRTP